MHFFDPLNATQGIWPRTAQLDWCEENYVVCKYIAEFWNTISNAFFIIVAIYGYRMVQSRQLGNAYARCFTLLGIVGVGSWLFHMTLLREFQALDELPMWFMILMLTYVMVEYKDNPQLGPWFPRMLIAEAAVFPPLYAVISTPWFFLVFFSAHVFGVLFLSVRLYRKMPISSAKKGAFRILTLGWVFLATAFLLWVCDTAFCPQLRAMRHKTNGVLGIALQFHALWHLGTGIAVYCFVMFSILGRDTFRRDGHARRISSKDGWKLLAPPIQGETTLEASMKAN